MQKRKRSDFARAEELLKQWCADHDCAYIPMEINHPTYQLAKIKGADFVIVAYPHTTSGTRNVCTRLRDEGSKNKESCRQAMDSIKELSPYSNLFSHKRSLWNPSEVSQIRRNLNGN